jgi:hypothetical protein
LTKNIFSTFWHQNKVISKHRLRPFQFKGTSHAAQEPFLGSMGGLGEKKWRFFFCRQLSLTYHDLSMIYLSVVPEELSLTTKNCEFQAAKLGTIKTP